MAEQTAKKKRRHLFSLASRQVGSYAMIQPHRAIAQTAAARKVGDARKDSEAREANRRLDREWQTQAYDYVEQIGELGYAQNLRANAVAACDFRIVKTTVADDGTTVDEASTDPRAQRVMDALVGPQGGRRELYRRGALHVSVGGDSYLLGTEVTEQTDADARPSVVRAQRPGQSLGIVWEFLSTEELQIDTSGRVTRKTDGTAPQTVPDDCYIARCWRSDARFSGRPDSEMRRVLAVCREIITYSKMIEAATQSRIPQGLLFVPDDMSFRPEGSEDSDDDESPDEFLDELFEHLVTPVTQDGSAATLVPLVLRGPASSGKEIKLIELAKPLDKWVAELREAAILRLAKGLDIPPEIISGKSSLSHWTAANLDRDFVVKHVIPVGNLLADFLTTAYLRPMLQTFEGMDATEASLFSLEFDPTEIMVREGEAEAARALHKDLALSDATLLRSNGFDEGDAPDDEELQRRVLLDLARTSPPADAVLYLGMIPGFEGIAGRLRDALPAAPTAPGAPAAAVPEAPAAEPIVPASGTPEPAQEPPAADGGKLPYGIVDRLAVAADSAVDRAIEKATSRVLPRIPGGRDRAKRVGRGQALTVFTVADLDQAGITVDSLLEDAWEPFAAKARVWLTDFLGDARAVEAVIGELTSALHEHTAREFHRPPVRYENGLRIPDKLVTDALGVALEPAAA